MRSTKLINVINLVILLLMVLMCLIEKEAGIYSFVLGLFAGGINLVMMIVYIAKKNLAWISCIIWLMLFPIIGFGCCAYAWQGVKL